MDAFRAENTIMLVLLLVMIAVKAFAFISSLMFSAEAYEAGGKLTKPAWCAILGIGLAAQVLLLDGLLIVQLAGIIAALVYLADVRPALAELTRR